MISVKVNNKPAGDLCLFKFTRGSVDLDCAVLEELTIEALLGKVFVEIRERENKVRFFISLASSSELVISHEALEECKILQRIDNKTYFINKRLLLRAFDVDREQKIEEFIDRLRKGYTVYGIMRADGAMLLSRGHGLLNLIDSRTPGILPVELSWLSSYLGVTLYDLKSISIILRELIELSKGKPLTQNRLRLMEKYLKIAVAIPDSIFKRLVHEKLIDPEILVRKLRNKSLQKLLDSNVSFMETYFELDEKLRNLR